MAHVIIGTAGHVDHGKTSLIKALTGVDTDRLKEEKERGITIQLGFAYFDLPQGKKAGIVDVPGHEKFVRNMLAGVGGMDIVLLVVAADEGVMPQTREHLNILRLLNVKDGIVVVTKKDAVDEELLELAIEDIKDQIKGTFLQNSPIVTVSSVTGDGIEELKKEIIKATEIITEREIRDFFRLPIDRVFTLRGFGTVVTGTLKDGLISVGDLCTLYPSERQVKIRSIQVHGQQVETAYPGQRTAINITGVEKEEVSMGDLLTTANYLSPKNKINCVLSLLDDATELVSGTIVRFHWGTEETYGRAVLLDKEVLDPGEECYCQIRLENNVVVARGDNFVIRSMSPVDTIGGGIILNSSLKRTPRFNDQVLEDFKVLHKGNLDSIILTGLKEYSSLGIASRQLATDLQINITQTENAVNKLVSNGQVIELKGETDNQLIRRDYYDQLSEEILDILTKFHKKFPLKEGINKEELRSQLNLDYSVKYINSIIKQMELDNLVMSQGLAIKKIGFSISLSQEDSKKIEEVLQRVEAGGYKPPSKGDLGISDNLINYIIQKDKVIILEDIAFSRAVLNDATDKIVNLISDKPQGVTLSDIKGIIDTSRKFLVPILEHLDGQGITKRVGEVRVLGAKGRELVK